MKKETRKKKLPKSINVKDTSGLVETLMTDLKTKGLVRFLHFGLFKVVSVQGRTRYDMISKKIVPVPTYKRILFTPAKGLKEMINS